MSSTFADTAVLWAELQRRRAEEAAREYEAKLLAEVRAANDRAALAEYPALAKEVHKLRSEVGPLRSKAEMGDRVNKCVMYYNGQLLRKVERRRGARAEAREIYFSPSTLAHRVWQQTGRCDWAAAIRMAWLSGADVMDFTEADARSLSDLADPEGFCEAVWTLRDDITRPVAELLHRLSDDGDPESDWFEAQRLLRALFAHGLADPTEARLVAAEEVASRFAPVAFDARTRSVVAALLTALA